MDNRPHVINNWAVQLRQQDIDDTAGDGDDYDANDTDAEVNPVTGGKQGIAKQARVVTGKVTRDRLIANVFWFVSVSSCVVLYLFLRYGIVEEI